LARPHIAEPVRAGALLNDPPQLVAVLAQVARAVARKVILGSFSPPRSGWRRCPGAAADGAGRCRRAARVVPTRRRSRRRGPHARAPNGGRAAGGPWSNGGPFGGRADGGPWAQRGPPGGRADWTAGRALRTHRLHCDPVLAGAGGFKGATARASTRSFRSLGGPTSVPPSPAPPQPPTRPSLRRDPALAGAGGFKGATARASARSLRDLGRYIPVPPFPAPVASREQPPGNREGALSATRLRRTAPATTASRPRRGQVTGSPTGTRAPKQRARRTP